MLKRIGVLGQDALVRAAEEAASGKNLEVVRVEAAGKLPPATTAILADADAVDAAVDAALAVGERQEEVLYLLSASLDAREGFAPGSALRVREHATRFAEALKLSPSERLMLERAALVRDVGKLKLSNDVLLKKSVLTYDEWKSLQEHPTIGAEMLACCDALEDTADVVRCHHECFDGSGYPEKIEGDAIPPLARALKILDVYCAMTSPRHYRKSQSSHEEAVQFLRDESGAVFDAHLANVFIEGEVGQAMAG